MTTVRDALEIGLGHAAGIPLAHLGIDPDTPDEWRSPDHCLTWLRERGWIVTTDGDIDRGENARAVNADELRAWNGDLSNSPKALVGSAPTLHAALLAACRAVAEQEAGT